jgi:hypothetical protein
MFAAGGRKIYFVGGKAGVRKCCEESAICAEHIQTHEKSLFMMSRFGRVLAHYILSGVKGNEIPFISRRAGIHPDYFPKSLSQNIPRSLVKNFFFFR